MMMISTASHRPAAASNFRQKVNREGMNPDLIEFLEVVINQILYLRSVYPQQIFKKQKVYDLPVNISLYPPLNAYIKNVLSEAMSLLDVKKLKRLEVRLLSADKIHESFFVDINSATSCSDAENVFRSCIHNLENRCKSLDKLTKDCTFKILLHTSSYEFSSNEPKSEDFLWVPANLPKARGDIVPIAMSGKPSLIKFYIEQSYSKS